ncbi:MAG TPA: rod shape-determining protein RodA [Actinomycetota bacterium]|nr:rod shape-determining protein RodA [Actinomycetota bacterium]
MAMEGIFGEAVDRIGGEPISARMARKAPLRHLDPTLLLVTLLLTGFGAVMIMSATQHKQEAAGLDPTLFLDRQLAYIVAATVVLFVVSLFDYRHFRAFAPVFYAIVVLALVAVITPLGHVVQGAQRWIAFGFFQLQPSEMAKVVVIVTLAAYFSVMKGQLRARDVAAAVGLVTLPSVLIFFQPDLGTMMVFVALLGVMLLVGGAKIRHLLVLAVLGAGMVGLIVQAGVLKDYQVQRITAFLDPSPDVQSEGYNLAQSEIAIGSGGISGKGLEGKNTQTSLDFIPEQHTDFIFTAVGEQLGFVGSATLLGLFAFLLWRALRIAAMSRDMFGTFIAAGIAGYWGFQLFINMGMTMGIMPITGIPLPFISYGGSSLITNYMAVGLLLNIHMRRFL